MYKTHLYFTKELITSVLFFSDSRTNILHVEI